MKVTVNCTSCPVTDPSPPVVWFGLGLMPFKTELLAVKLALRIVVMNVKVLAAESRESNATSEGELTRVGT